ncbi:MAG: hypothetical protein BMS9Abin26_1801 [Gammaproteobacteria bacterium]|nr:MAG: hypothetical protein BMS9Abin26_1801 [Gammaproteobacteria bacterium]
MSLVNVLREELELSQQLLECLQSENQALSSHDAEHLEKTTVQKQQLVNKLEQVEKQRHEAFLQQGLNLDADNMQAFLLKASASPEEIEIISLCSKVLELAEKCRLQNIQNGSIIEGGRQRVREALSILRGQLADDNIYENSGRHHSSFAARVIAKV